ELQDYLHAIEAQVDETEVVHEIESRMAELLTERGISGDKVVLPADVTYLQEQLGKPEDFTEDTDRPAHKTTAATPAKRLFRNTDNAMVAGVAAGLAQYFGIDVLIFRILFIAATFAGGWGIVLYLILWLLIPEAKTPSERLQMAGKPVTVNSLKEVVARADVASAAKRANIVAATTLNAVISVILKLVGIGLVLCGLCILLALFTAGGYLFVHTGNLFGQDIFPVGWEAHLLVYAAGTVAALLALLTIIFGVAAFKHRWPVSTWMAGGLVGVCCY
ncbi:MAG: PspC domain-containing protein, partial [Candidatus Micrarchaeaceae archaeon]